MSDFRELHGHSLELLLLLAGLLRGFLAAGLGRLGRVRCGRGRGLGLGNVLVRGEESGLLSLHLGFLLLLRLLFSLDLRIFGRSLRNLGIRLGFLLLDGGVRLGGGVCLLLGRSLGGRLVPGLGVVLLVLLHGSRRRRRGYPLLLHESAAQRVELHVVLLAQGQEVLLHHHDLDHDLVLLRRRLLRARRRSRRRGNLLLDGLLARGELVDKGSNLL